MGKAKRREKRARREARGTDREKELLEREAARARRGKRRRIIVFSIPVVTFAVAAVAYWGMHDSRAAGVTLLLGAILFFLLGLGTLGARVSPKDRDRAGSIDFGRRG